jgi:sulfoxide reductase heme-binding subunit YedZ
LRTLPATLHKPVAGALHIAVHIGALLPLVWLVYAIPRGALGGDPVKELIHYLGLGALRLLLLTLLVSPLARVLKMPRLNRLRRPLGLWCFAWASVHFATWLALDLAFAWTLIGEELVKRTYILLGFSAWLILAALAITSIPGLVRALGRRWKQLHGLIYVVVILGCIHFWWSQKSGWLEPALYLALAGLLLWLRREKIRRWLGGFA